MLIREQVPLAPLTTLGVGGDARYFLEAFTESEVVEGVRFARDHKIPLFVLGGGSNLVVSDNGFNGVVLKIGLRGVEQVDLPGNEIVFNVAAGEDWDSFVARSVESNCAGVECLSGIPGTAGGTPVQNVGAYGQEVSTTIRKVVALDFRTMQTTTLSNAECGFGYRTSRFNTSDRGQYIILRISFALRRGGGPRLRYTDLQKYFADRVDKPSLAEVRSAVLAIRQSKAMLIVPGDEDARSAGSFFKNPTVPPPDLERLSALLARRGLQIPSYPAGDGLRKLPAAWLVGHAGFAKGYGSGSAGISRRHTLAIINRGGAAAADIGPQGRDPEARPRRVRNYVTT